MGVTSSYIDRRDAENLKKTIFAGDSGARAAEDGPRPADAAAAADADATADAAADGAEAFASPEADRLFPRPTPEEAAHNLRDLVWGEHVVATRMAAARGNSTAYLYSLREAANFFLDGNSGGVSLGSLGSFAWVDLDRFVEWVRDTVGDEPFARVLEERLAAQEAYNDKIETMRQLLDLRMTQYIPHLPSDGEEEGAGEPRAGGDDADGRAGARE